MNHAIELRRTFIPVLLTMGVLTMVSGAMKWIVRAESPIGGMPRGVAIGLLVVGPLILMLAVGNMLQVKHLLAGRTTSRHAV
jgi:hypothetical protein